MQEAGGGGFTYQMHRLTSETVRTTASCEASEDEDDVLLRLCASSERAEIPFQLIGTSPVGPPREEALCRISEQEAGNRAGLLNSGGLFHGSAITEA